MSLCVLVFWPQFFHLRIISLSLAISLPLGALSAKLLVSTSIGSVPFLAVAALGGALTALASGFFDLKCAGFNKGLALLASLGLMKFCQGSLTALGFGGISSFNVRPPLSGFSPPQAPTWLLAALSCLIVAIAVLHYGYRRRIIFLQAIAVGDNRSLAALFGVSPARVILSIQAASGGLAGVLGVFLAMDGGYRPDLGAGLALKAFAILVLVGHNFFAIILTGLALVIVETAASYWWGGHAREAAGYALLAVTLLCNSWLRGRAAVNHPET